MNIKKIIRKNGNKYLVLETFNYIGIGKEVIIDNEKYLVVSSKLIFNSNLFINHIQLVSKDSLKIDRIFNKNIQGSSIEAKVFKINSNNDIATMQVDFNYGLEKKNKGYQSLQKNKIDIPYKTFYSKTNTGLFPTPEVDDIVDVVFNSFDESNLKVSWAIGNENSKRFNNEDTRIFKNKYADIELSEEGIKIISKNNLEINSSNLNISSKKTLIRNNDNLAIASNGYIAIESEKDMQIYSKEMKIHAKQGNIDIISDKDIILKGDKIHNN